MPPKYRFTREEMIRAALDLVREGGIAALTARGLGERLGSSAKPVFGLFRNMEEVGQEVLKAADRLYQSYIQEEMAGTKYPPYKASGMAYIRFAKEEKELFRLLFMRDRSGEQVRDEKEKIRDLLALIRKNTGLSEEEAYLFHLEMWIYVHGIATMLVTSYLEWDMEFVSRALTDGYEGLRYRYMGRKGRKPVKGAACGEKTDAVTVQTSPNCCDASGDGQEDEDGCD